MPGTTCGDGVGFTCHPNPNGTSEPDPALGAVVDRAIQKNAGTVTPLRESKTGGRFTSERRISEPAPVSDIQGGDKYPLHLYA